MTTKPHEHHHEAPKGVISDLRTGNRPGLQATKGWGDDDYCYGCGRENKEGFRLVFELHGHTLTSRVTFRREHQGYENIIHGGFLALVLDEVMANAPIHLHHHIVATVDFHIRFKKMVKVGQEVRLAANIVEQKGRKYMVKGKATTHDGTVVAEATAVCLKI